MTASTTQGRPDDVCGQRPALCASSRVAHLRPETERRVVDPRVGSWNQIAIWLSGVDAVRVEGAGKSL